MLEKIKLALRVSADDFDGEILTLINACMDELNGLGINACGSDDPQITIAVISYCKWRFGDADNAERWERNYYDMVSKLQVRSGYGIEG